MTSGGHTRIFAQVSWKTNFSLFSAVALASPVAAGRKEGRKEREWRVESCARREVGNKHHTTLRFYTDGAYLVHIMLILLAQYNKEHRTCIMIHVKLFPTIFLLNLALSRRRGISSVSALCVFSSPLPPPPPPPLLLARTNPRGMSYSLQDKG